MVWFCRGTHRTEEQHDANMRVYFCHYHCFPAIADTHLEMALTLVIGWRNARAQSGHFLPGNKENPSSVLQCLATAYCWQVFRSHPVLSYCSVFPYAPQSIFTILSCPPFKYLSVKWSPKTYFVHRINVCSLWGVTIRYIPRPSAKQQQKNQLRGLSPRTNYTDRATAACRVT
jgi:hypothetical protein